MKPLLVTGGVLVTMDAARSVNVLTGTTPGTLANHQTYGEGSQAAPALAAFKGALRLGWVGTDAPAHLNLATPNFFIHEVFTDFNEPWEKQLLTYNAEVRAGYIDLAEDRPGLLYDVASAMSSEGCNIEVVLIDTEAHKAIDVFYITRQGSKLNGLEAERLRKRLLGVL